MLSKQDLYQLDGVTAYDRDGARLGKVETVFVDTQTDDGTFAVINTGLFGSRSSFVPLMDANLRDGDLHVAYTGDQVKDAPSIDAGDRLDTTQELELYRYYGIAATTQDGGATGPGIGEPPDADRPTGSDLIADQGIDPMLDGPQASTEDRLRLRRLGEPVANAEDPRAARGEFDTSGEQEPS